MPWNEIEDGQLSGEKIPAGTHTLRVVKVIRGKADGTIFTSNGGDPQILIVVNDEEAREASEMLTLSKKAAWKLKNLLMAMGADLDAMDADGKDWTSFEDEVFAQAQLNDRPFRAEITWEKGNDGKEYARINPLRRAPGEAVAAKDDIPV